MTEQHTLHFRITGDSFTGLVRDMVLSERAEHAWRTVTEGLGGDGLADAAVAVFRGEMKFTGNESDGMGLEPDTDEATAHYLKDLAFIYSGRFRLSGVNGWWRPRSRVTSFGPKDVEFCRKNGWAPTTENRARYYAWDGERVVKTKGGAVCVEPVEAPPDWFQNRSMDVDAAVEACAAVGRHLEEDGFAVRYADNSGELTESSSYKAARFVYPGWDDNKPTLDTERQDTERRERTRRVVVAMHRKAIAEQAAGDYVDIYPDDPKEDTDDDGVAIARDPNKVLCRVPRAAFYQYALHRTALRGMAPEWKPVAGSGWKLNGDDPFHTDCFLGAVNPNGTPVADDDAEYDYNSPFHEGLSRARFELQRKLGRFECTVLSGTGYVSGVVGKDILVLPNLHPDHLPAMLRAKAVVANVGGRTAHLVQVALERNYPIVLVPGATTKFPADETLTIHLDTGRLTLMV